MGKMRAKQVSVIVFLLLMISFFVSVLVPEKSKAAGNYIYVDSAFHVKRDGSAEYPLASIQDAIKMAKDGDTIYVYGGVYTLDDPDYPILVINKKIKLWGSIEKGPSIIRSFFEERYTVKITADQVEFIGFTVDDILGKIKSPIGALICLEGNNVVVQSCRINHSGAYGIYVGSSSHGNFISGNVFNDTKKGLYIDSSHTNDIFDNHFWNCSEASIELLSCDTARIYNNIVNCSRGVVEKVGTKKVVRYVATFKNGIVVKDSRDVNISNNKISYTTSNGIYLYNSVNDIILNNELANNIGNGVCVNSNNGKIIGNTLFGNFRAISLSGSGFEIYNNSILKSTGTGFYADSASKSNTIYHNFIHYNAKNAQEYGKNFWYSSTLGRGNSWSDYDDVDLEPEGGDGIGDVYYTKGGVLDKYPIGVFLKPPIISKKPSPADLETNVGLEITLSVEVNDPNGRSLTVYFYNASSDELIQLNAVDRKVGSKGKASYTFNQGFDTTVVWYIVADNGKLQNKSDVWIFSTRAAPPANLPPVIRINKEFEGVIGQPVVLDASDSYDPDGEIIFYRWNFGDGTSDILSSSPSHVYSNPGEYIVTLTVVDDNRTCTTDTTKVTVYSTERNKKPVANVGGPYEGKVSHQISFDGSQSYDPDGSIVNYTWDFKDGTYGYGPMPKHSYSSRGVYTVTLTVTDNFGEKDVSSTSVTVVADTSQTPGFELLIAFFAIAIALLLRKRYSS
ncbi:MAG: PKD domain-containing protein [Candidatus Thermoplasmatota archaeon]|jgi:parallel beta-helix repeat protein|nr:PKD domain-containing protein [Candidatus Thermoplasmatota archaeon]